MELIEEILRAANLTLASRDVIRNKGVGGIDGMNVKDLKEYLDNNRDVLANVLDCKCRRNDELYCCCDMFWRSSFLNL